MAVYGIKDILTHNVLTSLVGKVGDEDYAIEVVLQQQDDWHLVEDGDPERMEDWCHHHDTVVSIILVSLDVEAQEHHTVTYSLPLCEALNEDVIKMAAEEVWEMMVLSRLSVGLEVDDRG